MNESEMVEMIVVLMPCVAFITVAIIAGITELIQKRHSADLFKDEEALKLLRYMRSDD